MAVEIKQALEELRKDSKKRKFSQSVDLVINLKKVDLRKDNISLIIDIPHKIKEKKVCGFLTKKNDLVKTVTKPEFAKFKDPAVMRPLINSFDFFIAHASLMPIVASTFGKALGPAGKMPSPQLGIITQETPEVVKSLLEKISKSVKIRVKEASVKVAVGKEDMKDEDIFANIKAIYSAVENALPAKKENIKNVKLKFTMSKPVEVNIK
jgi:large subunit ribosomal protein L1